ncbi:MAG: bifunctional methionine sulfoxide reductase B/A protein [Flavobacteriales bacterium]|nr:bifunctional methionine sulfoxide reductase B/A protein [Flavobacteriales bacterium]
MKIVALISIPAIFLVYGLGQDGGNDGKNPHKFKVTKTEAEWKAQLSDEAFFVLREKGTEVAFSGKHEHENRRGVFLCAGCGQEVFSSTQKFDSGSGWPSYYAPYKKENILEIPDTSFGWDRVEVVCSRCGGHLGHVFDDGPKPTGLRYCINSVAMDFKPEVVQKSDEQMATFGAGCFWCVEAIFEELKGVTKVESGYAGGEMQNPTYQQVSSGSTGYAEVVSITYQPDVISYDELLEVFWSTHDPTTLNKQGADRGTQYRSVVFYHNEMQRKLAMSYKQKLNAEGVWDKPVVTEISPVRNYFPAEKYHQDYYSENSDKPYCSAVITPKLEKFRKVFMEKLKH